MFLITFGASGLESSTSEPASCSSPITFGSAQASAPSDTSVAKLTSLSWLEGRWRGEWGPRIAEQVWFAPKAGTMEGMFRLMEGDKTLVIEFFTFVEKPDEIAFYLRHFTPTLAPWEKTEATVLTLRTTDGKKFQFENHVNGMPKSSTLTRVDGDTYIAHSEIVPETGEPQTVEIIFKRQPCATAMSNGGSGGRQKKP
jgi:hypothetical protein